MPIITDQDNIPSDPFLSNMNRLFKVFMFSTVGYFTYAIHTKGPDIALSEYKTFRNISFTILSFIVTMLGVKILHQVGFPVHNQANGQKIPVEYKGLALYLPKFIILVIFISYAYSFSLVFSKALLYLNL